MCRSKPWPVLVGLLWAGFAFAQPAERVYSVDAAASDVHWLVYKAGALARLGHNHAIAVAGLKGRVAVAGEQLADSRFELEFSVGDLVVDDPTLRNGLGADFTSVPTANDIAGTRTNMLSERVLNGVVFPTIRLTGGGPVGAAGKQTISFKVEMLGRTVDLTVPIEVSIDDGQVEATGQFDLNHADLGMQPFSVMMGALQVGEKLTFSYRIVARAAL